jgi:hypothetical protein
MGRAMTSRTLGSGLEGPGPMSNRWGGWTRENVVEPAAVGVSVCGLCGGRATVTDLVMSET